MERACHLLQKYANGKVEEKIFIHDNIDKTKKEQSISVDKINKVLGLNLTVNEIKEQFRRLDFPYTIDNNIFNVTIPNRRMDVSIKEDLIEEVGCMYGYDNIPSIPLKGNVIEGGYSPFVKYRKDLSKFIRTLGLDETRTHTLINAKMQDFDVNSYEPQTEEKCRNCIYNDFCDRPLASKAYRGGH